ncbi:uncharacterized protein [Arachis hypogaea]|uniref:uncharacterized protein n=1 Tax=Arachis hypogaea TaxID=3818 RepID=UPI003B20FAA7
MVTKWELYVDGASNESGSRVGILLKDNTGVHTEQSIEFLFQATNNQAEYEALLAGLRYGLPRKIISDNGRKFTVKKIASFLTDLQIKHYFSSIEHPQSNGLAEAANKIILQALRKKLTDAKGCRAELIPEILWSYNTTPQFTTNKTPFRLVYVTNCMIPIEVGQGSTQAEYFDEGTNIDARSAELDTINVERCLTELRQKSMQLAMQKQYNKKVRPRILSQGDLV